MNKILKWVLPVVLSIAPIMGVETPKVIQDSFFQKKGNFCITDIDMSDSGLSVLVEAQYEDGNQGFQFFSATRQTINSETDDKNLREREKFKAKLFFRTTEGVKRLEKEFEGSWKPYTPSGAQVINSLEGKKVANDALPLNQVFNVCQQQKYTRPDGSTYLDSIHSKKLYSLITGIWHNGHRISTEGFLELPNNTQAKVAAFSYEGNVIGNMKQELYSIFLSQQQTGPSPGVLEYCHEHRMEKQAGIRNFGQEKMRHAYKTYLQIPVCRYVLKTNGGTLVHEGPKDILLQLQSQESIGVAQKNRPNCTHYNFEANNFPPLGYRIGNF